MSERTDNDSRRIVAATLRAVAEWGYTKDNGKPARDDLFDIADQVERLERDEICCPVCEESTCDEGCPLEAYRDYAR